MLKNLKTEPLKPSNKYKFYVGIDTGVKTGFAVWDVEDKRFLSVTTLPIHDAMFVLRSFMFMNKENVMVRVEDARKRRWFGTKGSEALQGAGSIKRDAKIWEDFLTDEKANFQMVAPRNNITKMDSETFTKLTGWKIRTTNHARDAAMLVFGF